MKIIKKLIPEKYKRKIKEDLGVPSLRWSLRNLRNSGFDPSSVVDVGAYEGHWTMAALEIFPAARFLMVEAQAKKADYLKKVGAAYPGTMYSIALLSSCGGQEQYFLESETGSHVVRGEEAGLPGTVRLKTKMLDNLLSETGFPAPDLLKLDVQGHEMEVLKGAGTALHHAEVCLLEISLLDLGDGCPLLAEMVMFMDENGFQAYDISQLMRRPFDRALHQLDLFFVKKTSHLVASKRWR